MIFTSNPHPSGFSFPFLYPFRVIHDQGKLCGMARFRPVSHKIKGKRKKEKGER
jgi:hypothetical protein